VLERFNENRFKEEYVICAKEEENISKLNNSYFESTIRLIDRPFKNKQTNKQKVSADTKTNDHQISQFDLFLSIMKRAAKWIIGVPVGIAIVGVGSLIIAVIFADLFCRHSLHECARL
jgi:hypothetical protein